MSLLLTGAGTPGDSTPGGADDAYLLEDNLNGYELEDGTGVLLMESAT
jgi:hypothetical protein